MAEDGPERRRIHMTNEVMSHPHHRRPKNHLLLHLLLCSAALLPASAVAGKNWCDDDSWYKTACTRCFETTGFHAQAGLSDGRNTRYYTLENCDGPGVIRCPAGESCVVEKSKFKGTKMFCSTQRGHTVADYGYTFCNVHFYLAYADGTDSFVHCGDTLSCETRFVPSQSAENVFIDCALTGSCTALFTGNDAGKNATVRCPQRQGSPDPKAEACRVEFAAKGSGSNAHVGCAAGMACDVVARTNDAGNDLRLTLLPLTSEAVAELAGATVPTSVSITCKDAACQDARVLVGETSLDAGLSLDVQCDDSAACNRATIGGFVRGKGGPLGQTVQAGAKVEVQCKAAESCEGLSMLPGSLVSPSAQVSLQCSNNKACDCLVYNCASTPKAVGHGNCTLDCRYEEPRVGGGVCLHIGACNMCRHTQSFSPHLPPPLPFPALPSLQTVCRLFVQPYRPP